MSAFVITLGKIWPSNVVGKLTRIGLTLAWRVHSDAFDNARKNMLIERESRWEWTK